MNPIYRLIAVALLAGQVQPYKHQASLHLCARNGTVSVEVHGKPRKNGTSCQCQAITPQPSGQSRLVMRDDYAHTPGVGFHKLHTVARTWNDARHACEDEGGHLAIVNSKAEEEAMLNAYRSAGPIQGGSNADEAFLGVHDFYREGEWVTIFGESLGGSGYARWSNDFWGQQPDNKHNSQHCGALLFSGGLDDFHCHEKLAFFCELPIHCADY
ncbi:hemolymph lipopolysaccharide-binding protein-like [Copidosoma floridanum]|uniref:hemolymph lipopolysaccharide-binding protein-like n=1 Tax=Copidosoma floridanum TaxID=29053 RepID=UPI0006C9D411|nr:hemolymph lipopolysaccharide-binding protein-like [Copidosoma floridanum]